MKITGKKILVTGGASGIGFALAQRFVHDGNTVIICGRRSETLKEAAQKLPGIITYQADLADTAEREKLFKILMSEHTDLNVLVNNAGVQQWIHPDNENFFTLAKQEITINIEAPVHLCQLFLKMPSAEIIMNVTSGLSFVPLTKVPVYSATKAFFHSYTLSLRHLLKSRGVRVVEIIPPALNTDLGGKGIHDFAPPVGPFIDTIFQKLEQGQDTLTDAMSESLAKASPESFDAIFKRMNP